MRAVRFERYGNPGVLQVVEVPDPEPGPGQLLVEVRAAAINPGEAKIREGLLHDRFPASFPSGEGSDLAGVVRRTGDGVDGFARGEEVIAFTDARASHAELVVVEAANATRRPPGVPWEAAGSLYVAGTTAFAAVRAVGARPGDVIVVTGAAGGVGSLAVQLARIAGATVIGLAMPSHHEWLYAHDVIPIDHGGSVGDRIREAPVGDPTAMIDTHGGGYVEMGLDLDIAPERIDTIVDFEAARRHPGVKTEGTAAAANIEVVAELAALVELGRLEVPIAATYPLERVQDAFRELERGHVLGKIVLVP